MTGTHKSAAGNTGSKLTIRGAGNGHATTSLPISREIEWLEPDGLGGFASGTTAGVRTRRYHALLLAATNPPAGRVVLVNGFEAWAETPTDRFALTSHHYSPDVIHPDGVQRMESFTAEPWPTWRYRLDDGTLIKHEIFAVKGVPVVVLRWQSLDRRKAKNRQNVSLIVRPFLSGRDYHQLQRINPAFRFGAEVKSEQQTWHPYEGLPAIVSISNGVYTPHPDWYRDFLYEQERSRGLDHVEDLATPGFYRWDLTVGDAIWILTTIPELADGKTTTAIYTKFRRTELKRRRSFPTRLHRSCDDYIVNRGAGKTIVAGYPWFTDWGRDTFIALRGLCLARGRFAEARDILIEWAGTVSQGMLPNRFPDHGEDPEFNSVDASLWYIIAVHDYLRAAGGDEPKLQEAVQAILRGYTDGTRFNIHAEKDGLLFAGQSGMQLTWMDARVGDWVVTQRLGKPVEIQALWLNALRIAGGAWIDLYRRGLESFKSKFWAPEGCYLHDVIDPVDATFRPNQILAVGGLPYPLLEGERARQVVEAVEERLLTPLGLRSLDPGDPQYRPRYEGGVWERDGAYHQGTVWPWLLGPFVEAWLRVRGNSTKAKLEARSRFVEPLLRQLNLAGIGHLPEITDGEAPHIPRGCPWQAWSVGEALRIEEMTR
jgi:predicted glycogen debranching enzyme